MPDEFPTLEAALVIGTLVALARAAALVSDLRQAPVLSRALEDALGAGELARAQNLCERSKGVTVARFGHALVGGLGGPEAALGVERHVERALAKTRAGVRRGHARDLAVLAVLVGAGAYAARAELDAGPLFYGLLGVALALTACGALVRHLTLLRLIASKASLTDAARRGAGMGARRPGASA